MKSRDLWNIIKLKIKYNSVLYPNLDPLKQQPLPEIGEIVQKAASPGTPTIPFSLLS